MPNEFQKLEVPLLSVITVTYFSEKHILKLVKSLQWLCRNISFEHIIIDNGSTDRTIEILENCKGEVDLIPLEKNTGFSKANFIGYQKSTGQYLLFLNPDMQFENEENSDINALILWLQERKDVGIVGCKLLDHHGNLNAEALPRRFPKLIDQFFILLKIDKLVPNFLDAYRYKNLDFSKEQVVDTVRGSFMLMPRKFIETVGYPFDLRYFIWFEDVDICKEAKKNGFKVVYNPIISCKDSVGQSFKQQNRSWRFRQYAKSLFIYLKKWESIAVWFTALLFFIPLSYLISLKAVGKLTSIIKKQ